jgi:hypothetical protein
LLVCFVFMVFFPFDETMTEDVWDTISRIGGWRTKTKIIKTETLLHLNLEIFFPTSPCLSNASLANCWLVH